MCRMYRYFSDISYARACTHAHARTRKFACNRGTSGTSAAFPRSGAVSARENSVHKSVRCLAMPVRRCNEYATDLGFYASHAPARVYRKNRYTRGAYRVARQIVDSMRGCAHFDSTLAAPARTSVVVGHVRLKCTELVECLLLSRPPLLAQPFDVPALEAAVVPHPARS